MRTPRPSPANLLTAFLFALLAGIPASRVSAQTVVNQIVVLTGDHLPGTPAGVMMETIGTPAISKEGDLAFVAWLQGDSITPENNSGIWRRRQGGPLELVARAGDVVPGAVLGGVFESFNRPVINSRGEIAFNATIAGTFIDETNNIGIWSDAGTGELVLAARTGFAAPDTAPGVVFKELGTSYSRSRYVPLLSDGGSLSFLGELDGVGITPENAKGNWVGPADDLRLAIRTGEAAPGFGPDHTIDTVRLCMINEHEELVTWIRFNGPDVDETNNSAIIVQRDGQDWQPVLQRGAQAPGLPAGVTTSSVSVGSFNNDGLVSIHGRLTGPGYTEPSDGANWHETAPGQLEPLAYTFMPAPDTPDNRYFNYLDYPNINGSGRSLFFGSVLGDNDDDNSSAFWYAKDSSDLALMVRAGEQPAGVPDGVTIRLLGNYFSNGQIATYAHNANSWLYYSAMISGPGVDDTNDSGFWASNAPGRSALILRLGEPFDVDNNPHSTDLRIPTLVTDRSLTGGEDGYPRSLSDTNQFAYRVGFSDGSWAIALATFFCSADVNQDGAVSPTDFSAWINAFNNDTKGCDQNNDGVCSPSDFTAWIDNFNSGC